MLTKKYEAWMIYSTKGRIVLSDLLLNKYVVLAPAPPAHISLHSDPGLEYSSLKLEARHCLNIVKSALKLAATPVRSHQLTQ